MYRLDDFLDNSQAPGETAQEILDILNPDRESVVAANSPAHRILAPFLHMLDEQARRKIFTIVKDIFEVNLKLKTTLDKTSYIGLSLKEGELTADLVVNSARERFSDRAIELFRAIVATSNLVDDIQDLRDDVARGEKKIRPSFGFYLEASIVALIKAIHIAIKYPNKSTIGVLFLRLITRPFNIRIPQWLLPKLTPEKAAKIQLIIDMIATPPPTFAESTTISVAAQEL